MKRTITYTTIDGRSFETRQAAIQHETSLKRAERIKDCLRQALGESTLSDEDFTLVVEALSYHATEFTDALSARAARRESSRAKTIGEKAKNTTTRGGRKPAKSKTT